MSALEMFFQIHLHSGTDAPLNVTFIRAPPGTLLKVDIPLVFIGDDVSPGLKKGIMGLIGFRIYSSFVLIYQERRFSCSGIT